MSFEDLKREYFLSIASSLFTRSLGKLLTVSNSKKVKTLLNGVLSLTVPTKDIPDAFTYDPMNPVSSYGGNVCCTGNAVQGGSFDQSKMELRNYYTLTVLLSFVNQNQFVIFSNSMSTIIF